MSPKAIGPEENTPLWGGRARWVLTALVGLGALTFLAGIFSAHALRAWQAYLINYLFWSGLSVAGVVIVAMWRTNHAGWGHVLRGTALATFGFAPVMLAAFLPLIAGRAHIFPWLGHPKPNRAVWLAPGFLFTRDFVLLLALAGLCAWYTYHLLRPSLGGREYPDRLRNWMVRGWRGEGEERERSCRRLNALGPPLLILYAVVWSFIGFDLVMSLDQRFYSTLFGGYFFITNLYMGLAMIAVVVWLWLRREPRLGAIITHDEVHQLGKLLFAFDLLYVLMFWSQYLVIWYANLEHEIPFLYHRQDQRPWMYVSAAEVLLSLLVPFCILISRKVRQSPKALGGVALLILFGMWLERFVLVAPSLWGGGDVAGESVALAAASNAPAHATPSLPLGIPEALITAGFAAAFLLCYTAFARKFPITLDTHPEPHEHPQGH